MILTKRMTIAAVATVLALTPLWTRSFCANNDGGADHTGLWAAKKLLGPEIRGTLTIERQGNEWTAEICGRRAVGDSLGESIIFDFGDEIGSFRGELVNDTITGHWIQPYSQVHGARYATPVQLRKMASGFWSGTVVPLDDQMTFYLPVTRNVDGSLGGYLRNPERNIGIFARVEHVVFDSTNVKFTAKGSDDSPEQEVLSGSYDTENDFFTIYVPGRGGSFDFTRASEAEETGFYPRGKTPEPYAYRRPLQTDDGWQTATLKEVGISADSIGNFMQMLIDMPMNSIHASQIHGVLIARHGKLVLEEYFHGFHREMLHDTRSAAKSVTSVLVGAAKLQGFPIDEKTAVYEVMDGAAATAKLDERKRALRIEHLLTMSSGLDCDDSDSNSPGNEDRMQQQEEQPDWYRYTLDLGMIREPGEKAVYCSCNPNLVGGVLGKTTGKWLPELFRELVAEPLQITHYAMNLTPTGDAYMAGGLQLRLRDFAKLGQMMLDGGKWNGRQVVSEEWAQQSVQPRYDLAGIRYGYLWWVIEYPYQGRTVQAFFAGGNGGQIVMGVPELDLVIAFWGGNYSDRVSFVPQREFVPEYILKAVE